MNYMERSGAEAAAEACQGRAIVKGVPLRVQWGKPKPLDNMDRDQRMENARAARGVQQGRGGASAGKRKAIAAAPGAEGGEDDLDLLGAVAPPPGAGDVQYAAMAGE